MKRVSTVVMLLSWILVTGCAETSVRVNQPYAPSVNQKFNFEIENKSTLSDETLAIFRDELAGQMIAAQMLTISTDTTSKPLHIVIETAGTDHISSSVTVKDAITDAALAKYHVESHNQPPWGKPRGLMAEHAAKLVSYLIQGGPSVPR